MYQTTTQSPYVHRRRKKTSKEERVCPVCKHQFNKAEHLARHVRSHTKEKPFSCSICEKAFARQDTLLRHSRSHSSRSRKFDSTEPEPMSGEEYGTEIDPRLMPAASITPADHTSVVIGPESTSMTGDIMALMSPPNSTSVDKRTPNMCVEDNITFPTHVDSLTSLLPLDGDVWKDQSSPLPPPVWDYLRDSRDWDALLTGENFDLDAVNMSLLCATSDYPLPADTMLDLNAGRPLEPPANFDADLVERPTNLVQVKWHTFAQVKSSGQTTPALPSGGNTFIDESYRKRLAEGLQQRVQHGILPSTPFLDLCIQAYFSKFHPLFPIVHMPTFRPGIQNSILLLSICSAGSLVVGSPRAISHGTSMFERLNKAILSSWDTYMAKSGGSSLVALQACTLGQTFGLLLGRPRDLVGIDVFHGTLIAWARKAKLFNLPRLEYNILDVDGQALEDMWLSWVQAEVGKRIALGLHIHDAELARLHNHDPFLRHSLDRVPKLSSNELFTAPSANHWKSLMLEAQTRTSPAESSHQYPPSSTARNKSHNHLLQTTSPDDFELCGMLECISALACEEREKNRDSSSFEPSQSPSCHHLLTKWHTTYQPTMAGKSSWSYLMILWHSVFMTLHADFNAIECAFGREGYEAAQSHLPYARTWVHSMDAKRCLLHAMLIQKNFESLPAGAEPAFHVPMCLYYCGLVWSCFMCFGGDQDPVTVVAGDNLQFDELRLQGVDGIGAFLEQTGGLQPSKLAMGSLFRVIDLLQRISHWKISQSLASTLLALVEETQDLF
ncbi:hypothetical protein N7466_005711 [Penicillium verhagenii]|uniref:uncharacterized protein n=1 Tax=Penicillium verhagenii TaxID=1562060 RepID=UPI002544D378|nr:uncharacterized protein N7466_005711 [Penicillium verhagenii]KAJ5930218.1 hypothetical protein N7466_005711 [Penicillium verhagenii]